MTNVTGRALAEWDNEGGAHPTLQVAPSGQRLTGSEELNILQSLGAAVAAHWTMLPMPLQKILFERAILEGPGHADLRAPIARFLHDSNRTGSG